MSYIPKQSDVVDRFCQYLSVQSPPKWQTIPYLKRNFGKYQQQHSEFAVLCQTGDENEIALFWRQIALDDATSPQPWEPPDRQQLALEHLSAFLHTGCYCVAHRVYSRYKTILAATFDLSDCWTIIAELTFYKPQIFIKILNNYKPSEGNLENYCKGAFKNILQEKLNVGRSSDANLLYNANPTQLKKALKFAGEAEPLISFIGFAHKWFRKTYQYKLRDPNRLPNTRYPKLKPCDYLEISHYYNANKRLDIAPPSIFNSVETVTAKTIEKWFEIAIFALRNFQTKPRLDRDSGSQDNVNIDRSNLSLAQHYLQELDAEVANRIQSGQISESHRVIAFLHYGLGLNQEQVASRCGIVQENVSRHLSRFYIEPLIERAQEGSSTIEIPRTLSNWLFKGQTSQGLSATASKALAKAYQQLSPQDRTVFALYDGSLSSITQVSRELDWNDCEVKLRLEKLKADFEQLLFNEMKASSRGNIKKVLRVDHEIKINKILKNALTSLDKFYRDCLIDRYGLRMEDRRIADSHNLAIQQVEDIIVEAKLRLRHEAVGWIRESFGVTLDTDIEIRKLEKVIQTWLDQLYQYS